MIFQDDRNYQIYSIMHNWLEIESMEFENIPLVLLILQWEKGTLIRTGWYVGGGGGGETSQYPVFL